ncbi:FUSC family protein [Pseudodesulfovibrio sp.]|uniref:FUSC family protein n=1 Tax=unclassified Pseudodesulfovibrio TaxID=2661612 RepID=UPI003B001C23
MPSSNALHSVKAFLAAMLAFGIALYFDLDHPYWTISTVYIVSSPMSGTSASKGTYRLAGTVIGGIMTVLMVPPLSSSPEMLSFAILAWVSLCAYVAQLDRTPRGYLFQLAGYTVLLAGLPVVDNPGNVFFLAVSRVEEIGLAIICAILVNRIVFPGHVGPVVAKQIDAWMKSSRDLALDVLSGAHMDAEKTGKEWQGLTGGIVAMRELVAHVAFDASRHRELVKLLSGIQDRMRLLPPILSGIQDHILQLGRHFDGGHSGLDHLMGAVGEWVREGRGMDRDETLRLRGMARELEEQALSETGDRLLISSLAGRLGRFIEVWHECSVLHHDLGEKRVSSRSARLISQTPHIRVFRDHGQAVLAGLGTALAIAAPMAFWIGSAWSPGMLVTQMSGVFCCRWIGMDNPNFFLRKTAMALALTSVAAMVLNFTVFTSLTDFASLAAVLGLVMIPAGAMRKTPGQRITSALFCIFLPLMSDLHSTISLDFREMVMTDIGLVFGVICCLTVMTLVRVPGAEARSRYLLRSGWKVVAEVAEKPGPNHEGRLQRLLDLVSLWASRQVAIARDSGLHRYDLLRDLRLGHNLDRLQAMAAQSSPLIRSSVAALCKVTAVFYRNGQREEDRDNVLVTLQRCGMCIYQEGDGPRHRRMLALLLSSRLCLVLGVSARSESKTPLAPLWGV